MNWIFRVLLFASLFAVCGPSYAQTLPGLTPAAPAAAPAGDQTSPPGADAAKALIGILNDETARASLVRELERIAASPAANPKAEKIGPPAPAQPAEELSLARELSEYTQNTARDVVELVAKIWRGLANLSRLLDGSAEINWERLDTQGAGLLALMLSTFTALYVARWLALWPTAALARAARNSKIAKRIGLVVLAVAVDALVLFVAFVAIVAHLITTTKGTEVDLIQGYFVEVFVNLEAAKIALRAILQPRRSELRLLPISEETARYWFFWLARLLGFVGYGVGLVYPIVNATVGFAVGIGVRLAIVLIALVSTIVFVLRNRVRVRTGLTDAAVKVRGGALSAALAMMAHVWHVLVIIYLLVAFAVWVTRPFDALDYMAPATIETLLVILVGGGLMSLLSRVIAGGIQLPADVKRALPLLESRLNLLVPAFLRIIRVLMLVAIGAGILQAWGFIDIGSWMSSESGAGFLGRVLSSLIIVLIAMAAWITATSWIEYRLNPASGRVSTPRARTLFSLFRNAFTILLVVITAMLALSQLGVDIAPLIAGAGVVGLAVGFGSQKLVQDIITGAFIQLENAMNEGDVVTVAGVSGVVDRLTIRSVGIRDVNGTYHVIPFSSVDSVSNSMRGFAFHVADISIAYSENIPEVKRLMGIAFDRLMATENGAYILEPMEMNGITQFANNAVVLRVRIKTLPGQQWVVGRAYNEVLKAVFDENNVQMPFPQTTVWLDGGKRGEAPPASDASAEATPNEQRADHSPEVIKSRRRKAPAKPLETVDVPDSPDRKRDSDDDDDDGEGEQQER